MTLMMIVMVILIMIEIDYNDDDVFEVHFDITSYTICFFC